MHRLAYDKINELIKSDKFFIKMFDIVRIINPIDKKIICVYNSDEVEFVSHCYDFWERNMVCDNCISIRAYNKNEVMVKIESLKDNAYLIFAIPIKVSDTTLVLELVKDITKSISDGNIFISNSHFSKVIDNLNDMASKDELTGLYNRRYINEKAPLDFLNASSSKNEISLIMLDIDNFKTINDTYGHKVGDVVLKSISEIITKNIRHGSDWASRYGGEEFLIVMPNTTLNDAYKKAEHIRKIIETSEIAVEKGILKFTASFGVFSVGFNDNIDYMQAIHNADINLYKAKRSGKNRVIF